MGKLYTQLDTAMSDTSVNGVQNRAIKAYVDAHSGGGGSTPTQVFSGDLKYSKDLSYSENVSNSPLGRSLISHTFDFSSDFPYDLNNKYYMTLLVSVECRNLSIPLGTKKFYANNNGFQVNVDVIRAGNYKVLYAKNQYPFGNYGVNTSYFYFTPVSLSCFMSYPAISIISTPQFYELSGNRFVLDPNLTFEHLIGVELKVYEMVKTVNS